MRFLTISLLVFFVGCASYPKKQSLETTSFSERFLSNPYFSDVSKDYVYKANISVYDNDFGGLLIVKKVDDNTHRIAFTTEMGNKLFDFTFTDSDFKVNYILDDLDKKFLIQVLKTDFKVLIANGLNVLNAFKKENQTIYKTKIYNKNHYYFFKDNSLSRIVKTGSQKEKVRFSFTDISDNIANTIKINHSNIKLNITLKSINQ